MTDTLPAKLPAVAGNGLRLDIVAGLTAAAVVLPKAMAYATVAGLPVAVGLYTAFVPMVIYALLGTSRVLSFSSTATLAILAGTQLGLAAGVMNFLDKGFHELLAGSLVIFVALLPFFAIRELGRVIGTDKLSTLFFRGSKGQKVGGDR